MCLVFFLMHVVVAKVGQGISLSISKVGPTAMGDVSDPFSDLGGQKSANKPSVSAEMPPAVHEDGDMTTPSATPTSPAATVGPSKTPTTTLKTPVKRINQQDRKEFDIMEALISPRTAKMRRDFEKHSEGFEKGYDSDGGGPPLLNGEEEEFEEALPVACAKAPPQQELQQPAVVPAPNAPVAIAEAVIISMSVPVLKEELRVRNCTYANNLVKMKLRNLLCDALQKNKCVVVPRS